MTTPISSQAMSHLASMGAAPQPRDDETIPTRPGAPVPARRVVRVPAVRSDPSAGNPSPAAAHRPPVARRRSGWFEANPGSFGRVGLVAAGMGITAGGAAIWTVWRAWRSTSVRRARIVIRLGRSGWHRYRRLRTALGR